MNTMRIHHNDAHVQYEACMALAGLSYKGKIIRCNEIIADNSFATF
jgi:hypothetical protein